MVSIIVSRFTTQWLANKSCRSISCLRLFLNSIQRFPNSTYTQFSLLVRTKKKKKNGAWAAATYAYLHCSFALIDPGHRSSPFLTPLCLCMWVKFQPSAEALSTSITTLPMTLFYTDSLPSELRKRFENWAYPPSTPAHSHSSFPSGIAGEPDEQQALTYLNRERKVFWAGICLFPSPYPARYFRNEGFSLTGKEIELPWQQRPQHPFMYIGFDVRLAKSFNRSGNFFQSKLCPRSIWYGCGFPIGNLERQKNARWKYCNLPLPSIHWHAHSPPITHFLLPGSIDLSSPEFLVFISGFFCCLSFFSFFSEAKLAHAHLALARFSSAVGSGDRAAMKLLICLYLTRPRKQFSACSCSTKKQLKCQKKPSGHLLHLHMYFLPKKKRITFKYKSFKYINCRRKCTDICGCQSCESCDKGLHGSNLYYSEDEFDEAEDDEQETSSTV